mmetsp:Transcript_25165/g.82574  ORF Transcript_25165/g.82574 Transcript_25165/m.82574 type:complete len:213 (+) Transcript_25165:226-864(+)
MPPRAHLTFLKRPERPQLSSVVILREELHPRDSMADPLRQCWKSCRDAPVVAQRHGDFHGVCNGTFEQRRQRQCRRSEASGDGVCNEDARPSMCCWLCGYEKEPWQPSFAAHCVEVCHSSAAILTTTIMIAPCDVEHSMRFVQARANRGHKTHPMRNRLEQRHQATLRRFCKFRGLLRRKHAQEGVHRFHKRRVPESRLDVIQRKVPEAVES